MGYLKLNVNNQTKKNKPGPYTYGYVKENFKNAACVGLEEVPDELPNEWYFNSCLENQKNI